MNARRIAAGFGIAGALAVAAAPVAHADDSTTVSVQLVAGSLTISAPDSASFGQVSSAVGTVDTTSLGTVTVSDSRGSLLGWAVTAHTEAAAMTSGDDSIDLTVAGPLGWATGTVSAGGASILDNVAAGAGGFLSTTPIAVATAALGAGGGTYTYNPTLTFTVPANAKAGTYSVVVTQTIL